MLLARQKRKSICIVAATITFLHINFVLTLDKR